MKLLHRTPLCAALAALVAGLPIDASQDPESPQLEAPAEELDVDPEYVDLQEEVAVIPFQLGSARPIPVIEAMVNGEGPFSFYYDTGASVCVLHSGFVEELGIPILGPTQIGDHTASARIAADRVKMESLDLEGIRFEGIPAVAFDRSRLRGESIRGVLGLPLFRDHLLTVDYAKSRLTVSAETLPEEGPGIIPYGGTVLPEISITVGGKPFSCHIDSGSPGGFTFSSEMVESLPHKTEPRVIGTARTVNSEFEVWSVQLDGTIVVAGNEFVDPVVTYNEILPNGILGYQILKDLEISIDQRSKRVRLVPAEREEGAEDAEEDDGKR